MAVAVERLVGHPKHARSDGQTRSRRELYTAVKKGVRGWKGDVAVAKCGTSCRRERVRRHGTMNGDTKTGAR